MVLTQYLRLDLNGVATNIFVSYMHRFSIIKFSVSTAPVAVRTTIGTFLNNNDLNSFSIP